MTRNLKALGLTLIAVFAMSAVVASAAQAALKVTPAEYPAILTGEKFATAEHPNHVFTSGPNAVRCG